MEKKVLLALDGTPSSQKALDYLGFLAGSLVPGLAVTLLHVLPPLPEFLRHEAQADPGAYQRLKSLEQKARQGAQKLLENARQRLLRLGLAPERLELKPQPRQADPARDIVFAAEQGLYDAVVLGRRGLTKTQELFMGSVTRQVVQHALRLPVWVVGGKVQSPKVLCAVDGSQGSMAAVDHLAFMLGESPQCQVTLLHVGRQPAALCPVDFAPPQEAEALAQDFLRAEDQCLAEFQEQALKMLLEAGLTHRQVELKTRKGALSVSGTILEEARQGGYGTVVLGRNGQSRAWFLGHVSDKVVSQADHLAVWIAG